MKNLYYEEQGMPKDFLNAVKVIQKYCQNEDCMDDCENCPNPLSVIRCGEMAECVYNHITTVADYIGNMSVNALAIYLHSWQAEHMSVEEIKEFLCDDVEGYTELWNNHISGKENEYSEKFLEK